MSPANVNIIKIAKGTIDETKYQKVYIDMSKCRRLILII